jgi:hypothetical protein
MNCKQGLLIFGWILATAGITLAVCDYQSKSIERTHPFSKHQSMTYMQKEYKACKNNAPQGFDCYMQPMLVSEQFIKDETK